MAPLGEKLLEANVTCFSRRSLKDKSETLILGMHLVISIAILILTVVISESKSEIIEIVLVCNLCQFVPTLSFRMYKYT